MKPFIFAAVIVLGANISMAQQGQSLFMMAKAEVTKAPVAQAELPTTPTNPAAKTSESVVSETKGAIKTPKVFFVSPKDGATVPTKFRVKMGVEGIKIRVAGEAPDEITSGHHHLIIDGAAIPQGVPVPEDAKHLHFGKGQTETEVTLTPGDHTLTLQFADGAHRSFGDKLSATIKVHVK